MRDHIAVSVKRDLLRDDLEYDAIVAGASKASRAVKVADGSAGIRLTAWP
jgi:hypothetical protein